MALGNDQTGGGGSPGKEFGELEKREEMVGWLRRDGWMVGELATLSLPTTTGALVKGGLRREVESWHNSVVAPSPPVFRIQLRTTKIEPVTLRASSFCLSVILGHIKNWRSLVVDSDQSEACSDDLEAL